MKYIFLSIFLSIFSSLGEFFDYLKVQYELIGLSNYKDSGKKILFVSKTFNDNSKNFYDNRFYFLLNDVECKYEDLVNIRGKIIGLKSKNDLGYLIIQLENGELIKTVYYFKDNITNIKNICFLDELTDIRSKLVGKTILLNLPKKNNLILNSLRNNDTNSSKIRNDEKVKVLNVIPHLMYDNGTFKYYLKIESKKNGLGYVNYEMIKNKISVRDMKYFNYSPFVINQNKYNEEYIKNGLVSLGMTKFQVFSLWGTYESIDYSPYGYEINRYSKNRFVQYDDNLVIGFCN
tara:strand:- start:1752 stop:2621 length:870 start_codon:yes stop_codon:yes gene_type:complete